MQCAALSSAESLEFISVQLRAVHVKPVLRAIPRSVATSRWESSFLWLGFLPSLLGTLGKFQVLDSCYTTPLKDTSVI